MIKHTVDEEIKRNMKVCGGRIWQIFYKPDYWMNSDYVGNQKLTFPMWVNYIERVYKCQFIQLLREDPVATLQTILKYTSNVSYEDKKAIEDFLRGKGIEV